MLLVELIIGLGVFLFGMLQLERSLETLSSAWMRRALSRSTANPVTSVLSGTLATALVQSSSMVGLMVLAFASAGIIPLYNAIGVILGANLGTTMTGWVVATLGFKLDLAAAAMPVLGVGALLQVFSEKRKKLAAMGQCILGIGLLLLGLEYMKSAVDDVPQWLDISRLAEWHSLSFLLMGVLLTALIQSSSAAMMIALSALYAGVISLEAGAAFIIGADLGTTSTVVLGSLKGSPIKRQLALAHFVFNLVVDLLAFFLLLPLLPQLLSLLAIKDPLYSLVAFHSCFNTIGLLLFMPCLKRYTQWIAGMFNEPSTSRLHLVPAEVPDAGLHACHEWVEGMRTTALKLNCSNLHIDLPDSSDITELDTDEFELQYESLKQQEGELLQYLAHLQQQPLSFEQACMLEQLIESARESVYAVKTLKDVRQNLIVFRMSQHPELQGLSQGLSHALQPFYRSLRMLMSGKHNEAWCRERLEELQHENEQIHQKLHDQICNEEHLRRVSPEDLSTMHNVIGEIRHSGRSMIKSLGLQ
jgi:phosphate:Na+ symporter